MSRPPIAQRACMHCRCVTYYPIIIGESDTDRDRRPMNHYTWCPLYNPKEKS